MIRIELTPELRQSISDFRAIIENQIAKCQAAKQPLAAFTQLSDAHPILEAIADHWRINFPAVIGRQIAPFFVAPDVFRDLCRYCGAAKAAESLRSYEPHKDDPAQSIPKLFAILDRALAGKIYLTEDLSCEKDTAP